MLYEDSSVIWFRDRDRLVPEGGLFLRDAPEMLAAGQVRVHPVDRVLVGCWTQRSMVFQWVSRVPNKPEIPAGCDLKLSIAMGARHRDKVHWFICKSEAELM